MYGRAENAQHAQQCDTAEHSNTTQCDSTRPAKEERKTDESTSFVAIADMESVADYIEKA